MVNRTVRTDERPARRERGIALIVALLVMVIMTLLGVPFLLMGETENRIAENERLSMQALYAADAGAKMVVRWFDRPMNASNVINPGLAILDRQQRLINADGDPSTAPVAADGTLTTPWYKQGVDKDADGNDDVFGKPYRPSLADSLMGTEAGPDIVIDETKDAATKTFLTNLSEGLLAGYPAAGSGVKTRISRIDIYEPPWVNKGGTWKRYGIGTVKVVAKIFKDLPNGSEEVLSSRMVKLVLNEIPYYQGDLGPLHSCDDISWDGDFTVHWGLATAVDQADLHNSHDKLASSLPRVPGGSPRVDLLWGWDSDTAWDAYYKDILEEDDHPIDDPWLRFVTAGSLNEPSSPVPPGAQPWPFTWNVGDPLESGDITFHPGAGMNPPGVDPSWDGTHSNALQNTDFGCPVFEYETWKGIAKSGGLNVHYYVHSPADGDEYFKENGTGTAMHFRDITDNASGLFFFDTADQQKPRDDDADDVFDNLTPSIKISGGTWGARGMIYLNAYEFETTGVTGREGTMIAPREPYQDENQNGKFDTGERWINLDYPTAIAPASQAKFYAKKEVGPNDVWDPRGPEFTEDLNMWGILYTNGYYNPRGNAIYHGSTISFEGVGTTAPTAGTAHHYWDQRIEEDDFPPDEWGLPRVHVTHWETDL